MAAGKEAKEFGSRVELVPIPLSKRSISIVDSWICIAAPLIVSRLARPGSSALHQRPLSMA